MKPAILLALVFFAAPGIASSRPTPKQEEEIKNHIVQGRKASRALREDPTIIAARSLKRQLEAEMGLPPDATRAPTEAELDRLNPFWGRDRRGDYARATKAVDDLVRARDFNLNRALELSGKYYQIRPSRQAGVVRHNADRPNLGSSWQWGRLRFHDGSGPGVPEEADSWISPESGAVNVLESAFTSPAMLAYMIVHEASHYHLALADAEYGMLKLEDEVWVNKSALLHVKDFGLSTDEVRFIFRNTACQYAISREERRRMAQGQSPTSPHGGFGLKPNAAEMAELLRAADADLAAFDMALARGVSDEEVEALKAGAQSEFVRDMKINEVWGLVIAWRSARENDAAQPGRDARLLREQQEEAVRARGRQIAEAAASCGFAVAPDGDFYAQGGSLRVYHRGEVDRARAALLLIDACQREGRPEAGPCNDAIGIVSARWAEPKFKDSMMVWKTNAPFIDGESTLGQCLWDLHQTWNPWGDFTDLKSTVERNRARRLAGRPKPPAPQTPREPRPPRESPPPSRGDGQCYQSNDGREICP